MGRRSFNGKQADVFYYSLDECQTRINHLFFLQKLVHMIQSPPPPMWLYMTSQVPIRPAEASVAVLGSVWGWHCHHSSHSHSYTSCVYLPSIHETSQTRHHLKIWTSVSLNAEELSVPSAFFTLIHVPPATDHSLTAEMQADALSSKV